MIIGPSYGFGRAAGSDLLIFRIPHPVGAPPGRNKRQGEI